MGDYGGRDEAARVVLWNLSSSFMIYEWCCGFGDRGVEEREEMGARFGWELCLARCLGGLLER